MILEDSQLNILPIHIIATNLFCHSTLANIVTTADTIYIYIYPQNKLQTRDRGGLLWPIGLLGPGLVGCGVSRRVSCGIVRFSFGGRDLQLVELPSEFIGARTCIFLAHLAWKGVVRRKTMTRAAPREALLVTFAINWCKLSSWSIKAHRKFKQGRGRGRETAGSRS